MSRLRQFKLPDLGEGLTEGEILQWLVAPGDTITLNQLIVEVETAKAAVEVPSPYAGVVHEIHHQAGEVVDVGAPIITVDTDPSAGPLEEAAAGPAAGAAANPVESAAPKAASAVGSPAEVLADTVPAGALIGETGANGRTATLVGYGPEVGRGRPPGPGRRRARRAGSRGRPRPRRPRPRPGCRPPPSGSAPRCSAGAVTVLAKPPVRKLAKRPRRRPGRADRHRPARHGHPRRRARPPPHPLRRAGCGRAGRGAHRRTTRRRASAGCRSRACAR